MPDSLRNRRLNPTFSHLKIDGAKAENDDKDSGNSSVSRARSHYQIINFQNWDQRWQHLQEERERLRVQQERFSALLPPDFFLSDDDQSSSSSDPSLHSDQSKGQIINFKKLEKCDPALYQRWQHLQEERKRLRVQQERFLARLSPDFFLSDDDQSSRPSDPSLHSDDAQSSRPSDLSLHSDWSKGQIINFKKLEKCDPDRYQMWQHLQKQRERLRVREERFSALLPPDCFLRDDDQSSRPSDPSLHSDQSTGKIIDFKKSDKSKPARDQMWQRLQGVMGIVFRPVSHLIR